MTEFTSSKAHQLDTSAEWLQNVAERLGDPKLPRRAVDDEVYRGLLEAEDKGEAAVRQAKEIGVEKVEYQDVLLYRLGKSIVRRQYEQEKGFSPTEE